MQKTIIGNRYGRLTVISLSQYTASGEQLWLCSCECGNQKEIRKKHLVSGNSKSCGCMQKSAINIADKYDLTKSQLVSVLDYNPKTGVFIWKEMHGKRRSGDVAGSLSKYGYILIGIGGHIYMAHRLAYLYVYGRFPANSIDHINGVRSDNRIANLRDATASINGRNKALKSDNKSGVHGVTQFTRNGKQRWLAKAHDGERMVHLKSSFDLFEAICARKSAENRFAYHPNHGRARIDAVSVEEV